MLVSNHPSKALLCLSRLFPFLKQKQLQAKAKQAGAWEINLCFTSLITWLAAVPWQARLVAAAAPRECPCFGAAPPQTARAEVAWESPS